MPNVTIPMDNNPLLDPEEAAAQRMFHPSPVRQIVPEMAAPGLGLQPIGSLSPKLKGPGKVPPPKDNYRTQLSDYADTIYREERIGDALLHIPSSNAYGLRTEDVYFSGTPELAIGQGSNKGIVLEFDPAGWVGKVSKEKPGWETSWGLGQAEYTARPAPGVDTKNSLRAFTVKPDAIGDKVNKMVLKRTIESLIAKGWTKTVQDDGAIRMERPPTMRDSLEQAIKTIGG